MNDSTAVPRSFVVFSCPLQAISSVFDCASADGLANDLSGMWDYLDAPEGAVWRRVARRAFSGTVVAFQIKGSSYLILPASSVSFYLLNGKRFEQIEEQFWTPADLELSRLEEQAELDMGIRTMLSAGDDGSITLTKIAPDGTTDSRQLG